MHLPKASENIFPRSRENFEAILDHYFPLASSKDRNWSLEMWMERDASIGFAMNQVLFGAKLSQANSVLLDLRGFSSAPAPRIYYVLMCLFVPVKEWDPGTSSSHKERLSEFREIIHYKGNLLSKVINPTPTECVFPKSKANLKVMLAFYFPDSTEDERINSIEDWLSLKASLGHLAYVCWFCRENEEFLSASGIDSQPGKRTEIVLKSIFYPDYFYYGADWDANNKKYKKLKKQYLEFLQSRERIGNDLV